MKKLLVAAIIFLSGAVFAEKVNFDKTDRQVMHLIFNGQIDEADSLISDLIANNPSNPKYMFYRAPYNFYGRYFSGRRVDRDSIMQVIIKVCNKTIEMAELKEETTEIKFILGNAYNYMTRAHVLRGEFWNGYWAARNSRYYLREALGDDPALHDAKMGLAVIDYYPAARITGFYSALLWLGGMSGDRELALNYFRDVFDKGDLFKAEGGFALGMIENFFERDIPAAKITLSKLHKMLPDNNFVMNQLRRIGLVTTIEEKGVDFLKQDFDKFAEEYNITNSGVLNGIGYYFMNREQYDQALEVFKYNIELYPEQANPYDSCGECYRNMGDNANSIKYYRMAFDRLDTDPTINEAFRERLREGISNTLSELGADVNS